MGIGTSSVAAETMRLERGNREESDGVGDPSGAEPDASECTTTFRGTILLCRSPNCYTIEQADIQSKDPTHPTSLTMPGSHSFDDMVTSSAEVAD